MTPEHGMSKHHWNSTPVYARARRPGGRVALVAYMSSAGRNRLARRGLLRSNATHAKSVIASDARSSHESAVPFPHATALSFRRSAPDAVDEAVRQGVVQALDPHWTFRAHSLCGLDASAIGRKEQPRARAPTAPVQHPGWFVALVGQHVTTQLALQTARNTAATASPRRDRSSRPASPTADRTAPKRDIRQPGAPTPCHRRLDGTLARHANTQTVDDPPAA